ncbi:hypothetical protein D3C76_901050 [compost metagenome]
MIRQTVQRFGSTEEQVTTRLQRAVDAQQDVLLHLGGEVDQHVAAEHDVELAEARVAVQQVEGTEFHPALDRRLDRPAPRPFRVEITLQALRRQAAADGQAVVLAGLAVVQHGTGQVGGNNLYAHPQLAHVDPLELVDGHRQRIRFLARRACCRPDAQALTGTGLDRFGQYLVLQDFKRVGVTKPQGFVGGHGIHHLLAQTAARLGLHALNQFPQRLDALLFHQFVETAGDQVLLVFTEQNATGFFQEHPELFEIQITRRQ